MIFFIEMGFNLISVYDFPTIFRVGAVIPRSRSCHLIFTSIHFRALTVDLTVGSTKNRNVHKWEKGID
jgi:hypothetical protein